MGKQLKIIFMDGSVESYQQNKITHFTVDEKSRIVYIVYPTTVVRIPFENIKMIEETRS